jgi:hypothetical protein
VKSRDERACYLENLEAQRAHLLIVENTHKAWAKDADNEMVAHLHIEVTYLIKEARDRINLLLETLNGTSDKA